MNYVLSEKASRLAYWLLKDVDKAIRHFKMIAEGDHIAVAVSGGKDSLTLLQLLDYRRKKAREHYSLCAIHILGDSRGAASPPDPALTAWLEASGFDYTIKAMGLPEGEPVPMNCHRCTRHRRQTLFQVACDLGCNKIAFGHHADDLAETTLLNLIFSGRIETMAPKAPYFNGQFHLIRPLCYLPEKEIRRFARACDFPPPPSPCQNINDSRRQKVAALIHQIEPWGKDIRVNLLRTGLQGIGAEHDLKENPSG